MRIWERTNSADTKVSEEGDGGGAPGTRADIPLQPLEQTMVRQAVPQQPMEVHGGAEIHLHPVEGGPHTGEGGCLKEAVAPWGACAGAGSWQDLWTCSERSPRWSRFAVRARDPMGNPRWSGLFLKGYTLWKGDTLGQFMKSCSPREVLVLEQLMEDCLPRDGPTLEQGKE